MIVYGFYRNKNGRKVLFAGGAGIPIIAKEKLRIPVGVPVVKRKNQRRHIPCFTVVIYQ
jgi:hypothetical protein